MSEVADVTIRYARLTRPEQTFVQRLVHDATHALVTFMPQTPLSSPVTEHGDVILEDGSPVVWFTFPGAWHDIGRFHLRDGTFTGIYANVLTPVQFEHRHAWSTTDLCLDVWIPRDGAACVLDEDELVRAETERLVTKSVARRAREEAAALIEQASEGSWPPVIVREWTLEKVLEHVAGPGTRTGAAV